MPIRGRPSEAVHTAVVPEAEIADVCLVAEAFLGVVSFPGPAAVEVAMPRAGGDDVPCLPAFELLFQPITSLLCALEPCAEVVSVTGGEIAEVFPAEVDRNTSLRAIGQADERVRVGQIALFEVRLIATGQTVCIPARVHKVQRRFIAIFFTVHLDAEADLTEIICAVHAATQFFRAMQGGEQQPAQDRNDRDHHQQLNQAKRRRCRWNCSDRMRTTFCLACHMTKGHLPSRSQPLNDLFRH